MIECSICYNPLTDLCAAACGHIFCLACIEKWFAFSAPHQLVCKCPNCNLAIYKSGLRKVYISQSEALVEELSALRIQVKDLDACNNSLKTEVEGLRTELEGYQNLTVELLADMYVENDDQPQERNTVASAIYSTIKTVFLRDACLLGAVSAFYDAVTSVGSALLLQTVLLGIELVWRVVNRPEECLRKAALYVWIFTDFVASAMILAVVLLGVLCGDYDCMVIWLDFGYPRLCGLVECMKRRSSAYLVRRFDEQ
ncbi:hypothetical protein EV421DRAFT_981457 [Armillaria borealis]|uniref:RING-type domain-containing protein n=1 Tax=Armillaria borealis TaxID=47425 RepID=A0AA39MK98_9AGAR|nr:hypothetical protein EV421DRAFT_981457 [Armillaria borealis]